MSNQPVQLFIDDTFIIGPPLKDGEVFKGDVVLKSSDGTVITIKQNGSTVYRSATKTFESTPDNKIIATFVFPINTVSNDTNTMFTTPDQSVYNFSDGSEMDIHQGIITKRMLKGTVNIKPPVNKAAEAKANQNKQKDSAVFINNAVKKESSSWTKRSSGKSSNPFINVGKVVFKLLMDMIVVCIFWILFVSISCWLMVPSEYIYPTDIKKYPFIFYKPDGTYYNITTPDLEEEAICKKKDTNDTAEGRKIQNEFFEKIKGLDKVIKDMLTIIYPKLVDMDEDGVNFFSSQLTKTCEKESLNILDYVRYVIVTLVFQNFLYCNVVTSKVHSMFSYLSTKILVNFNKKVLIVLFAFLLYTLYMGSDGMANKVTKVLRIKMKKGKDMNSQVTNQLIRLVIYIISCCLTIVVPLCIVLVLTSLMVTSFTLFKNIISPYNNVIWVFSIITMLFSLGTYLSFSLMLSGLVKPKDLFNFKKPQKLR